MHLPPGYPRYSILYDNRNWFETTIVYNITTVLRLKRKLEKYVHKARCGKSYNSFITISRSAFNWLGPYISDTEASST